MITEAHTCSTEINNCITMYIGSFQIQIIAAMRNLNNKFDEMFGEISQWSA
jgi:hypothetical protein